MTRRSIRTRQTEAQAGAFTRRKLLGAMAATTVLTPLAGRMAMAQAGAPVTLWHGWTGADNTTALNEVIGLFNAENPSGIVEPTAFGWDELFSKWVISAASGDAPDVVLFHTSEVPEYVDKGLIVPLDEVVARIGLDLSSLPPASVAASTVDGELYAVPVDSHPLAMYYNVDLVEAAGLDPANPPKTGDELIEWAKALTVRDEAGNVTQYGLDLPLQWATTRWTWFSFMHQFGGTFLNEDGTAAVDSEASRQALQFMVDLIQVHGVANPQVGDDAGTQFTTGNVAIRFSGPWEVNLRMSQGMNFMTAPLPVVGSQPASWNNSHCLSISAGKAEDVQAAGAEFVSWFSGNFAIPATTVGIIPLSPVARDSEQFTQSPQYPYYKAFVDTLDHAVYEPSSTRYTQIFSFGTPTPLVSNLQAALSGSKTVDQALADMAEGINAQLARG